MSDSTPQISVALSVFNGGENLKYAVDSILNQTFTDWELLLFDDGSTDGMVEKLAKEITDPRVKIFCDGKNKKLAGRLNEAIHLAKGKYYARMDDDDIAHPERLQKQFDFLENNPSVDVVGARCITIDEDNNIIGTLPTSLTHEEICAQPWRGFYLHHPTWMGKIEWFKEHQYKDNPAPYLCEDQELILRAHETSKYHALDDFLLAYRLPKRKDPHKLKLNRQAWFDVQKEFFEARNDQESIQKADRCRKQRNIKDYINFGLSYFGINQLNLSNGELSNKEKVYWLNIIPEINNKKDKNHKKYTLLKKFSKPILSLLMILGIGIFIPLPELIETIKQFEYWQIIIAFILISLNIFLSSVRLHILIKDIIPDISFKNTHNLNIFSQIAGYFFFSTLGQMIARSSIGAFYSNKASKLAVTTLLEKIIAVSALFLISLIGAWSIFHSIIIITHSAQYLYVTLFVLLLTCPFVYLICISSGQKTYLKKILRLTLHARLERAFLTSVLMHLSLLAAYTILSLSLTENVNWYVLASIFSIVMLGAAIPISFSGWGIRELSAGFAFSAIGLNPAIGISVALCIGLLSAVALGIQGLITQKQSFSEPEKRIQLDTSQPEIHIERIFAFLCSLLIPVLISIQVRVPINDRIIPINLADPFVIVMALTFLSLWFIHYRNQNIWRIKWFSAAILMFVLMIGYGWLLAQYTYGSNTWADLNRGFGVFILLSYLFSGAMITTIFSSMHTKRIVHLILVSSIVHYCIFVFSANYVTTSTLVQFQWKFSHYSGFIGNRNALGFIFALSIACTLGFWSEIKSPLRQITLGLFSFLLIASGSFTAMACTLIIVVISLMSQRLSFLNVTQAIGILLIASVINLAAQNITDINAPNDNSQVLGLGVSIDEKKLSTESDRFLNYKYGFSLWKENPIFGSGLGSFIEKYKDLKVKISIHNTMLWVLAEMGMIGLLMLLVLPICIIVHLYQKRRAPLSSEDFSLLLVILVTISFSQLHEILYQRFLWLLLGILVANKINIKNHLRLQ